MSKRHSATALLVTLLLVGNARAQSSAPSGEPDGKALFEAQCGSCHTLDLPRSQRLDRANWEWVMDDMVNKFGAVWIQPADQKAIINYLTTNYGPDRPR
jgi:cytochrome c5